MPWLLRSFFLLTLMSFLLNGCASVPNVRTWENNYQVHRELIAACRTRFPDANDNPSGAGGIAFVRLLEIDVLCLYGSLKGVDSKQAAIDLANGAVYSYIVVRSSGGAVETWLSLAEALAGRVENILVDELCMSSCANYIFPVGRYKYVSSTSLTVWHGGPTINNIPKNIAPNSNEILNSQERFLQNYAVRTESLYRWLNINPEILDITSSLSLSVDEKLFIEKYNYPTNVAISGYAVPPRVLTRCFGFTGLDEMYHLVNIDKIYELGRSKSSDLNIVVLPDFYDPKLCKWVSKYKQKTEG